MNEKRGTGRKAWARPELTILVRSRPEEAVLYNCKNTSGSGGNNTTKGNCTYDPQDNCYICSTAGGIS